MKNKKKISQDMKDILLTNLVQALTIILFGFLCGYLLKRNAKENGWQYFIFSVCLFFIIGSTIYLVKVLKQIKKLLEKRARQEEYKKIEAEQDNE